MICNTFYFISKYIEICHTLDALVVIKFILNHVSYSVFYNVELLLVIAVLMRPEGKINNFFFSEEY